MNFVAHKSEPLSFHPALIVALIYTQRWIQKKLVTSIAKKGKWRGNYQDSIPQRQWKWEFDNDWRGEMWVQVWNDLRQQVRHRLRTKGKEWPHISHLTSHNDYYYCCQAFSFSKFPIFCLLICFISNFKSSRPETGLTFLFFTELYKRSAYYTLNGLSVCLRTQLTQIIMLLWS